MIVQQNRLKIFNLFEGWILAEILPNWFQYLDEKLIFDHNKRIFVSKWRQFTISIYIIKYNITYHFQTAFDVGKQKLICSSFCTIGIYSKCNLFKTYLKTNKNALKNDSSSGSTLARSFKDIYTHFKHSDLLLLILNIQS